MSGNVRKGRRSKRQGKMSGKSVKESARTIHTSGLTTALTEEDAIANLERAGAVDDMHPEEVAVAEIFETGLRTGVRMDSRQLGIGSRI